MLTRIISGAADMNVGVSDKHRPCVRTYSAATHPGSHARMNPQLRQLDLPGGLRLEYAEQGPPDGLPVLLLHGLADSWRSFEPMLPYLPARWRVIAPSQRGHGGSDKPDGAYRTCDFAADAAALIEALALAPVVAVGHSMGAANAMRLAIDNPAHVRGLVGVGAFAGFGDKAGLVEFFDNLIAPLADPVPPALADAFRRRTLARKVPQALLQTMVEQSLMVPARVWRGAFAGLFEDDLRDELHRVGVPVLLLRGGGDTLVPASDTDALLRAMPHAQQITWPGFGHAPHWEAPRRFAEALAHFVHHVGNVPAELSNTAPTGCSQRASSAGTDG